MFAKRIICIFVVVLLRNSQCKDDFFVADKYSEFAKQCVTNSTFALSSITENIQESSAYVSDYIPAQGTNTFDCDITDDYSTRQHWIRRPWSLKNSSDLDVGEIILDRRWEDMDIRLTKYVNSSNHHPLNFITVRSKLHNNFNIPLSMRIEKEAHIFLCDGRNINESNCYWFMLQAFKEAESAIRKCTKGFMPIIDRVYLKEPCWTPVKRIDYPEFPLYLTHKTWSHFKLTKIENHLSFTKIEGNNKTTILEFFDEKDLTIKVTHMIIHSKIVNGLWKLHELEYIYTNEETYKIQLGRPVYTVSNLMCISMFIRMCQTCKLKLTLAKENNSNQIFGERTYRIQHSGWTEIKFIVDNIETGESGSLHVSTIGTSQDRFWTIDKVRVCQKKEFRMISLGYEPTCQLMSLEDNVITTERKTEIVDNTCPENTIGKSCVPCQWVFSNCEQIEICAKDQMTNTRCGCSAGYYGKGCYNHCKPGSYGHGCQKPCGKCNGCNAIDGTCLDHCTDNYTGPKCDQPPGIFFKKAPEIGKVSYTSAKVYVTNFEVRDVIENPQLYGYTIQYKKADDQNQQWIDFKSTYSFYENKSFTINNLQADTKYFVRGVIILERKSRIDGHIPFVEFTTKCQEIGKENIKVRPSNTSVNISLIKTTELTCEISKYRISIFDYKGQPSFQDNIIIFEKLIPFTQYEIIIDADSEQYEQFFRTTEGVPKKVRDMSASTTSSSAIQLKWTEPVSIFGNLQHYAVQYQHLSSIACGPKPSTTDIKTKKVTTTFTTIEDLTPYSNYSFSVFAVNAKFEGAPDTQSNTTFPSDTIQKQEIPEIINTTPYIHWVRFEFSEVSCNDMRGPLLVQMAATCTNEWCQNHTKTIAYSSQMFLNKLTAFVDYDLQIKFCRSETICSDEVKSEKFKTKPTAPHPISNLLVYSKTENSISLRWRPPFPPTGTLEDYKIYCDSYLGSKNGASTSLVNDTCKLWPEFHCVTLYNLSTNFFYIIRVNVRNEDPQNFIVSMTGAKTSTEPSEAPYDLNFHWTLQNDLELEWKHPNVTNGDIQYFQIEIVRLDKNDNKTERLPVLKDAYSLTYHYQIEATNLLPSTQYRIEVSAYNGHNGKVVIDNDTSPPEIPSLDDYPEMSVSNDTISVKISPIRPKQLLETYCLFLLVSDKKGDIRSHPELQKIEDFQKNSKFRIVFECNLKSFKPYSFLIGDDHQMENCNNSKNPSLNPGTFYDITIILINTFRNKSRNMIYSLTYSTPSHSNVPLELLPLLLIIPIAVIIFMKRHQLRKICGRNSLNNETVCELDRIISNRQTHQNEQGNNYEKQRVSFKPILLANFEQYIKESIRNQEFEFQHAITLNNSSKTTYEIVNIKQYFDYIDMDYVDGHTIKKAYITAEIPKSETIDDFWSTIWEENIQHIVLIDNIYENTNDKPAKYWPDQNEKYQHSNISIQHYGSPKIFAHYEYRKFIMIKDEEIRQLDQLHFSSWPQIDKPLDFQNLVPFVQAMSKLPLNSDSPIFVHSGDVKGVGFVLLCDMSLRMTENQSTIDVSKILQKLSNHRSDMVNNFQHYKLAHLVVYECLFSADTSIPCNYFREFVQSGLHHQLDHLKNTSWLDQIMKAEEQEDEIVDWSKNRCVHILPEIQGRVLLSPLKDAKSSYINAVAVDGFRSPQKFIITQQPMPNTLADFWRLVYEKNVSLIISLNEIQNLDLSCCNYWPDENRPRMDPSKLITVKYKSTMVDGCYTILTVQLHLKRVKQHKTIEIITIQGWPAKTDCPNDVGEFVRFCDTSSEMSSKTSNPIIITCYDGARACGLYAAMLFNIENIKHVNASDVCSSVRIVRRNRQQFVKSEEQLIFLHLATAHYIKVYHSY